jgi:class 3 adenylate cyclase
MGEALIRAIVRASGSPDPLDAPLYREAHIALFEAFSLGAQIFGEDAILQFMRVLGASAARVAEAAVSLFSTNVAPRLREREATEMELVRESAEAVRAFTVVPVAMDILIREHFVNAIRRVGLLDAVEGGAVPVAIGFVDLVESTQLSQAVGPEALAHALREFENAALDASVDNDCRVVKLIGDGVMVAGHAAPAVVDVVVNVIAYVERHGVLGTAHGAVASGYAVARDGDYFGPVVNLASRLAGAAPAGELFVTADVRDLVSAADYQVEAAGDYELKGFAQPVEVTRLRPN